MKTPSNKQDLINNLFVDKIKSVRQEEDLTLGPLLAEINLIQDPDIQRYVRGLLLCVDQEWWSLPNWLDENKWDGRSALDEYHLGGLILHTRRVCRIVDLLADPFDVRGNLKDIVMAAAILHELTRFVFGDEAHTEPMYDNYYPYTVENLVSEIHYEDRIYALEDESSTLTLNEDTAEQIFRIIRCHLGRKSPVPETMPVNNEEMLLHVACLLVDNVGYILDGDDMNEERWVS